jgi:hypothetical protein
MYRSKKMTEAAKSQAAQAHSQDIADEHVGIRSKTYGAQLGIGTGIEGKGPKNGPCEEIYE